MTHHISAMVNSHPQGVDAARKESLAACIRTDLDVLTSAPPPATS
jgi:hypothetical protein